MTRFPRRLLGRVRMLAAAVALAAGFAGAADAQQLANIKFTLDWQFQGPTGLFLRAQQQGYYREVGLNVTVDAGQGSAGAIQRVVSGAYEMGFADINSAIEYNAQNPDRTVRGVMILYDAPPFSVMALRGKGITTPRDLAGKRLGAPQFDASFRLFPSFAAAVGIDRASVQINNMAPPLRETMLQRGEVDFITGHYFTSFLNLKARGVRAEDIVVFRYRDAGLDFYGNGVIASAQMIAQRGPQITAFIRATIRAQREIVANPRLGVEAVMRADPSADAAVEAERLDIGLRENIVTDWVKANGLGGIDEARFNRAIQQVSSSLGLARQPSLADMWDGRFLPPAAERMIHR